MISEDTLQGFRRVWLRGRELEVAVLPELGGKLQTLRLLGHPHNMLLAPPAAGYRRARPGDAFDAYDTSGWDECFPTVAPCPDPAGGTTLPDHGALWSVPWWCEAAEVEGAPALRMGACLPDDAPWHFERTLGVTGRTLRLSYEVRSRVDRDLPFLWSAHPLLAVGQGARIVLPDAVRSVFVEWSRNDRLGPHGAEVPWPGEGDRRLDVVRAPSAGTADKLFTPRLSHGACALHDARTDVSITFRFDAAEVPWLGLWICQGGWPESQAVKHFTVALEPATGRPDALSEAVSRGEHAVVPARGTRRWLLEATLGLGPPRL